MAAAEAGFDSERSPEVAFVEVIEGERDAFELWRGEVLLPVAPLAVLHEGDRIAVIGPDAKIRLRLSSGEVRTARSGDDPIVLEPAPPGATVTGNLIGWIGTWFEVGAEGSQHQVALVARGMALTAPLLGAASAKLVSGSRLFALAWQGGVPPFRVSIRRDDDARALYLVTHGNRITAGPLELGLGWHLLEIEDAAGGRVSQRLDVVATMPSPPSAIEGISDGPGAVVEAGWLASQPDGAWVLEAYTRLAIPNDDAARRLARLLEQGIRPSPYPPDATERPSLD